ncbi:MAG: Do family serine endopeptidase [Luteitalea sp.]|nr:Do family serine endopeptidase [Luteitalea sp.]
MISRRFTIVTVVLVAVVAFLVGAIVAGGFKQPTVAAGAPARIETAASTRPASEASAASPLVNFADIVERINPAVVNIDATTRSAADRRRRRQGLPEVPEPFERQDFNGPRSDAPRRGAGSGFIIDADGSIITNHHVIDGAERIVVKLSDGRTMRARVVGTDPDTDIALIKVDGQERLPVAPLGDSATLRMGEWVCAIGNPLGYEHSVTVGVVSFLGRKLFDPSLDNYIQTDAAINFGNSGGPLINARGEVIGINAAISSRASNIGFAVPINGASAIIPQLRASGRVSRGYIGVGLRDIDADLQRSLGLPVNQGALVQDVTADSPADRAGLRTYDVIVSFDGAPVGSDDELIKEISSKNPGDASPVGVLRDGRPVTLTVKLAERPQRDAGGPAPANRTPAARERNDEQGLLGLSVRDLDAAAFNRYDLPKDTRGVLITRVEAMSSSSDAEVQRGTVLLEINRKRIGSVVDYHRFARAVQPGDIVTLYLYAPQIDQRQLKTVRVEER